MSHRTRPVHRSALTALTTLVACLGVALAPSPASAAQRLETIDLPSTLGNVDVHTTQLNGTNVLKANVLLPDGYDTDATKAWPVLYLLPGVGDNYNSWAVKKKGRIATIARGFQGIIVMPEAGRGYLTDWWRGGGRSNPRWQQYYLDEVVPAIQSKYRILPGRQNHAIGGISMGGFGGVNLAEQFPSYFGSALSLSGLLDSQAPESMLILPLDIGSPYMKIWGNAVGAYATLHNPIKNIDEMANTNLYMSTGNGIPLGNEPFDLGGWTTGALSEYAVWRQNLAYITKAKALGIPVTYSGHPGVHDWPYWRHELPRALASNLFKSTPANDPAALTTWTYRTMAPHGNMWGFGYTFSALPFKIETFKRSGQTLSATGAGTVTITPGAADTDASGNGTKTQCAFTTTLPFTYTLPAGC
ncbi:MAG: alpha/beta hydrolase-fold protein [Solirubrobacteraceae bacterium]|nr:alpha/beta hydrolase-fold protein [Patulibacter sp.]